MLRKQRQPNIGQHQESGVYKGVIYGDKELDDLFGRPDIQPIILDNIECSHNAQEFLKLPADFRCFNEVTKHDIELAAEVCATKQRCKNFHVIVGF